MQERELWAALRLFDRALRAAQPTAATVGAGAFASVIGQLRSMAERSSTTPAPAPTSVSFQMSPTLAAQAEQIL